jgi:hypothetical protein
MVSGGQRIEDMTAFGFLSWMGNKLSNIKAFSADAVELTALIQSPPMSRSMPNSRKVEILRKLEKLNIPIS